KDVRASPRLGATFVPWTSPRTPVRTGTAGTECGIALSRSQMVGQSAAGVDGPCSEDPPSCTWSRLGGRAETTRRDGGMRLKPQSCKRGRDGKAGKRQTPG